MNAVTFHQSPSTPVPRPPCTLPKAGVDRHPFIDLLYDHPPTRLLRPVATHAPLSYESNLYFTQARPNLKHATILKVIRATILRTQRYCTCMTMFNVGELVLISNPVPPRTPCKAGGHDLPPGCAFPWGEHGMYPTGQSHGYRGSIECLYILSAICCAVRVRSQAPKGHIAWQSCFKLA